jgi:acetyl esterase/lipase
MLLVLLIAALLLLYALSPRGTLRHEALHLPLFWLSALSARLPASASEKISYGPHLRQYYLLCTPRAGQRERRALLIYLHGGSWRWGKPAYFRAHAHYFNQLGYTVVLPAYRTCPNYHSKHIRQDLEALLCHVHQLAAERGLPCDSALIGGMSAGGQLAAWLALAPPKEGLPDGWLRACFSLGAPMHLSAMPSSFALRDFAGPAGQSALAAASPYTYAGQQPDLPMFIAHGSKDGMVPCATTRAFAQKRRALANAPTVYLELEGGTHLGVAAWIFRDGPVQRALEAWLLALGED